MDVAQEASNGLGKFGKDINRIVDVLTERIEGSDSTTKAMMCLTLRTFGRDASSSQPAISQLVHDESSIVRFFVTAALSKISIDHTGGIIPVPWGSKWSYLDDGSNQGTTWRQTDFDASSWKSGPAELGYGDGDEATRVIYGPNPDRKHITT